MFTYIKIFDRNNKVTNGYAAFEFKDDLFEISFMNGMRHTIRLRIPIDKIKKLHEERIFGRNVIFDYDDCHYVLLDSGFGESDYLHQQFVEAGSRL